MRIFVANSPSEIWEGLVTIFTHQVKHVLCRCSAESLGGVSSCVWINVTVRGIVLHEVLCL